MVDDDKTNLMAPPRKPVIDATVVEQDISPGTLLKGDERTPLGSGILVGRIGKGGMAAVYKIKHPVLETYYAVKIALPEQQASHGRFVSEAKITAKLDHPNIIRIRETGTWNSLPYIEMDYIDGITLREVLDRKKALPVPIACAVAVDVAKALKYAHTKILEIEDETYKGIIHRDLKPENIMISYEGRVVVMDFGLARPIQASLNDTLTGCFNGTPQYAPPEQLRTEKEKVDQRIDIYAMGVILYEMLCGEKPFRSFDPRKDKLWAYAEERATTPCIPLQKRTTGIPSRLVRIVDRCLDPDETKRYGSAVDLLSDLQAAEAAMPKRQADKEESLASYVSLINIKHAGIMDAPPRKFHSWMFPAVIGLGAAILGLFVVLLLRTGPGSADTSGKPGDRAVKTEAAGLRETAPARGKTEKLSSQEDFSGFQPLDPGNDDDFNMKGLAENGGEERGKSAARVAPASSENTFSTDKTPKETAVKAAVFPHPADDFEALRMRYGKDDPFAIALAAVRQGRYGDALTALDRIPATHPDADRKTVSQFECYVRTGRLTDARRTAGRAGVSSMEYDYFNGRIHFAQGAYDKAIDCFNRALLNKPLEPRRRNEFIDETLYYTAHSYHQRYRTSATENDRIAAREAWRTVAQRFSGRPGDTRYKEAIRALSEFGE